MLKRWAANIGAVLALLLVSILALVILALAANLYQVFIQITLQVSRWANTLWVDLFYVLAGLLWLGFFIFIEHLLFSPSSRAGLLLPRTLYICGLEIITIALLQTGIAAYGPAFLSSLLLPALELPVGVAMVWFSRRKPRASLNS